MQPHRRREPVARTMMEAEMYLALNPCPCDSEDPPEASRRSAPDGRPVLWYDGPCPRCRLPRPAPFALPLDVPSFGMTWETFFGGPEPSTLIDAGEWMDLGHGLADTAIPSDDADPRVVMEFREWITLAVAATTEIIKFIEEPGERATLPPYACWTSRGRAKLAPTSPYYRTCRGRLQAYRHGLSRGLMELGGGIADGVAIGGRLEAPGGLS